MPIPHPTPPRVVNLIVIHCSASPNGRPVTAADIDAWHHARGFRRAMGWRTRQNATLAAIGYHFLIRVNGAIETGRHLDEIGAHVAGNNRTSIGVCMAGTDRFAPAQWDSLKANITALTERYPSVLRPGGTRRGRVCGHRDLSPDRDNDGLVEPWEWLKTCPGFNVGVWFDGGMTPPASAVLAISPSGDLLRGAQAAA